MNGSTRTYQALLFGKDRRLMQSIPGMLVRAGFEVDVIASRPLPIWPSKSVRLHYVPAASALLPAVLAAIQKPYDLVIPADDPTIGLIVGAAIPDALKLKLLPVCGVEHFSHLYSKIGLAQALHAHRITSPAYRVAHHPDDLPDCGRALGYPLLVKVDASGAGEGVYECRTEDELKHLGATPISFPVLVQEMIEGQLLDVSGFYQAGQLVHFGYATIQATVSGPFSPSSRRRYRQLSEVPAEVFDELQAIGHALGLNGFANLACLLSQRDGKRYYFEADTRPIIWSDYTKYIGNDLALAIRNYFQSGTTLHHPVTRNTDYPATMHMVCPQRMPVHQLLLNRHQSWKWFCREGLGFTARKFALKLLAVLPTSWRAFPDRLLH
jgi:hypothetical protein